jgi:hypothetical protein
LKVQEQVTPKPRKSQGWPGAIQFNFSKESQHDVAFEALVGRRLGGVRGRLR